MRTRIHLNGYDDFPHHRREIRELAMKHGAQQVFFLKKNMWRDHPIIEIQAPTARTLETIEWYVSVFCGLIELPPFISIEDLSECADDFMNEPPDSFFYWTFTPEERQAIMHSPFRRMNEFPAASTATYECEINPTGHIMLVDRSSAGPDSGDMDFECLHCGQYFHVPLY